MSHFSPLSPPALTRAGDRQHWGQLSGSSAALAMAESIKQHPGFTLVVTADSESCDRLTQQLRFFLQDQEVLQFPDWETLPYDNFSPHEDIISERLLTLNRLPQLQQGALVVPVTTLMHRLAPPSFIETHALVLEVGQTLQPTQLRDKLERYGYHCVDTVYQHGEYAIRGSVFDLFPMGQKQPIRIDLFDDEIDTLRFFDPENQRSHRKTEHIRLLPAKEFPLNKQGINQFRGQWHERFEVDHKQCPMYQDISQGLAPPGIEYYLPLFFEQTASLFDFLPSDSRMFAFGDLETASEHFWQDIQNRYDDRKVDPQRPILPPMDCFVPTAELFSFFKDRPRATLHQPELEPQAGYHNAETLTPPALYIDAKSKNPLASLDDFLLQFDGKVLFCVESSGRRQAMLEILDQIGLIPTLIDNWQDFVDGQESHSLVVAPLDAGLYLPSANLTVIVEDQLFGAQVMQSRRRGKTTDSGDQVIRNLTELRVGAPVVHIDNGVGRYLGLQTLEFDGQAAEFLTLEYANSAKLYVPVSSLHMINRYSGADDELAPLHRLGSEQWQKAKRKAAEKVRDAAAELLEIYARRAARSGHQFTLPDEYNSFANSFPFEETPDQQAAIKAVIKDMTKPQSMDRLVCGDVGFGKTEVAMRAAFIAAFNQHQVVVLVPTTLLAQQHYESFKDRFADWPISIDVMSRFRSNKEQQDIASKLADGKIDILIGTHKLLQSNLDYQRLGLLIIDEEHRFGVRQKDRLKSLRSEVDILNLTATPIPRTLSMSVAGIRDLSIIATPPARRLSVKTFVREQDDKLIKEAVLRELLRGGQVYFLHNEVKSIEKRAREITEMIPEARVAIGHGQMRERELEKVMSDFYHKRYNVLLCTTIIETGIDVPSANTIVIERADKFGLAQLHQLRGRVGRSHHQAYAYLMTPPVKTMTSDASKRLDAISTAQDLGAGFTLATHDMEIRGAGELLGDEQSGQIQSIGYSLYLEMLDRAVKSIRDGKELDFEQNFDQGPDINLRAAALIPDDYLPDVHNRLIMYKRIANATSNDALRELQVEMIDRFGLLPEAVKTLFRQTQIKLRLQVLGIAKLEVGEQGGRFEFHSNTQVDPLTLVQLVQSQPTTYQLVGGNQLKFMESMSDIEQRFEQVEMLIDKLTPKAA